MLATRSFTAARHCFTSRGASLALQVRFLPSPPTTIPSAPRSRTYVFTNSYQGRRFYATKERVAKFEGVKNSDVSTPAAPAFPAGRYGTRKLTVRRVTTPSA